MPNWNPTTIEVLATYQPRRKEAPPAPLLFTIPKPLGFVRIVDANVRIVYDGDAPEGTRVHATAAKDSPLVDVQAGTRLSHKGLGVPIPVEPTEDIDAICKAAE